jgi:hypothetical protein
MKARREKREARMPMTRWVEKVKRRARKERPAQMGVRMSATVKAWIQISGEPE